VHASAVRFDRLDPEMDFSSRERYTATMAQPPIPPDALPKISPRTRLQTDRVTGKPVLLYPEGALLLNPTAEAVVGLCTGENTVEVIISKLAARYGAPVETVSGQVRHFLERLRAKNLLQVLERAESSVTQKVR
jgi:pyrroloquinoline quinone biosynthesis protein D